MVILGAKTLQLAFGFVLLSMLMGAWYVYRRDLRFMVAAQRGLLASSALVLVSTLVLLQQLMVGNYHLEYIARHSSAATPTMYKIAGLWAGMEGSLLFWAAILAIYLVVLLVRSRKENASLMPVVTLVLGGIMFFFLLVTSFFENPFTLLPPGVNVEARGMGLNPLLQHPVMLIHPPTLYLGYVGFAIPFAFAISALVNRRLDATWIRSTRRWTLVPWLFLGIGIILGGRWAYVELGWGGYWAWDPVENASFMPWLTGTAYLHSVIIQEKKNMLKMWNVILIMSTFTLTIFGTYLTRSGLFSSVHAFAATELGLWFFGFVIFIIVSCALLIIFRRDELAGQKKMESFTSRESGFLFNNMIFVAITLAILWGTMFPILSEAVRGTKITVGAPYFDRITTPMGLILLALTGIGPMLAWRRTTPGTLKRHFLTPLAFAVAVAAVAMLLGVRQVYPLINVALVAFVTLSILLEFVRGVQARRRMAGEGVITALRTMVDKNRRRYGGYLVHLGIVAMFLGFAGKAFTVEKDLSLAIGESAVLKDYVFTLTDHAVENRPNHQAFIVGVDVTRDHKAVTRLRPEKRFYTDSETPNSEVAIFSRPWEDLYAIVGGMDEETEKVILKVMINPLVQMVWLGGIVMLLGTIVAIWPSRTDRQIREKLL